MKMNMKAFILSLSLIMCLSFNMGFAQDETNKTIQTQKDTNHNMYSEIFNNISDVKDVKMLTPYSMNLLADDIRKAILHKVNKTGGHLGPDLGIVEATIALHYVFNSPKDKIVYDVSHQIYPHKILTGRKDAFLYPEKYPKITGYSNPKESEHDFFTLGHTSTSLSLAGGLAKARDVKKEEYNVIALIGDGSLSGGEALEGLSNGAILNSNFIVIVNDNSMAIAPVEGGIYNSLKILRDSNGKAKDNIFKSMGYDYLYVKDGNNVEALISAFSKVKDTKKPTIVHIITEKGKGFEPAQTDKETYHYVQKGFIERLSMPQNKKETYESIVNNFILDKKNKDSSIVAITPATPGATGMTKEFRNKMGKNYVDCGIAEQHAIGFASGLAYNGAKPVVEVMSSFIQRSYDQLSQDLAINESPATLLVFGGGITGSDITHLGIFDIPLISNIPNIVYLSPTNKEELLAMLDWSLADTKHPKAIRIPKGEVISTGKPDKTDYSILNKYKVNNEGEHVAIIAAGNFYKLGQEVQKELEDVQGIKATLINPCYLTGIDKEVLEQLKDTHTIVVTLEDGLLDGGFGEKITRYYSNSNMKVLNYGAQKEFTDRVSQDELFKKYHLTKDLIVQDIIEAL